MAGRPGFEPGQADPESAVLPLYDLPALHLLFTTKSEKKSKIFLKKLTLEFKLDKIKKHWRSGRVVEGGGLENRCAERHRGFESYLLRQ